MKKKLDIQGHVLLIKHTKLNEQASEKLLKDYNILGKQLPVIFKSDPSIEQMDEVNPGDIVEITRDSETNKTAKYYRVVVNA
jgi:DNA-directed RNA polymerase subunit H (RpoH/RPB5)